MFDWGPGGCQQHGAEAPCRQPCRAQGVAGVAPHAVHTTTTTAPLASPPDIPSRAARWSSGAPPTPPWPAPAPSWSCWSARRWPLAGPGALLAAVLLGVRSWAAAAVLAGLASGSRALRPRCCLPLLLTVHSPTHAPTHPLCTPIPSSEQGPGLQLLPLPAAGRPRHLARLCQLARRGAGRAWCRRGGCAQPGLGGLCGHAASGPCCMALVLPGLLSVEPWPLLRPRHQPDPMAPRRAGALRLHAREAPAPHHRHVSWRLPTPVCSWPKCRMPQVRGRLLFRGA